MTADQFIDELQGIFDKQLKSAQRPLYRDKLMRFTPEQRVQILNRVLEEAKYFPKVSEIFKAATELGYLAIDTTRTRVHRWKPSDCKLCAGEGRLCVTWIAMSEQRGEDRVEVQALKRIVQYTLSCDSRNFVLEKGEFPSLFRCKCLAGDSASIPKSWPKWRKGIEPVRYM